MRRSAVLILSLVLPLTAAGAQELGLAEILARNKEASGGAAWDDVAGLRLEAVVTVGGLDGAIESWEDLLGCRYASSYQLGPLRGAEGFDGRVSWSRDNAGQVRVGDDAESRESAANDAYLRCFAYWYPERWPARVSYDRREQEGGRSFHVVAVHPRGGRRFELWIDAESSLLDRTLTPGGTETVTDFFSDYREAGPSGVRVAFHLRSTNGQAQYDQLVQLRRASPQAAVDEAHFRIPESAAEDSTIAGGASRAALAFELLNNHVYVRATVHGEPGFRFLVDTGGANALTPRAMERLGLRSQGTFEARGVGEKPADVGFTQVERLTLGGVEIRNQTFLTLDLSELYDVEGFIFDGLLGFEIFKRFVVTIDYAARRLVLTRPEAFSYDGPGAVLPFTFKGRMPQVDGAVDGLAGKLVIDTGSRSSLILHGPFVEEHGLSEKYANSFVALAAWGVGGGVRVRVARAGVVRLGGVEIPAPVVQLADPHKGGVFADRYVAGNVGGGVLQRFKVTFDYSRQQMILEKNAHFDQRDVYDRAGLWLNVDLEAFAILDVVTGGPADLAGLSAGERIVAIDGRPAAQLELAAVRELFRGEPGTEVRLRVAAADDGARDVVLTLRDLI